MYFNNKNYNNQKEIKKNIKIDNVELLLSKLLKNKIFIIGIAIFSLISIILIIVLSQPKIYLELSGKEEITIQQGTTYKEPGYKAYNSKDENLTEEVIVKSNLNINKIGEYEITYKIKSITKKRIIKVVKKEKSDITISLTPINDDINIYLGIGDIYEEPGYKATNSKGKDLTNEVKVTGNVDTTKEGEYILTYSIYDNDDEISVTRTVTIIDSKINLSLETEEYTNKDIIINIDVENDDFYYLELPNGTKVSSKKYTYEVSKNGIYTFKTYNKKGIMKEESIEVKNIDRTEPSGTCILDQNQKGSFITITATDESGIKQYKYKNNGYTETTIQLNTTIEDAKITIIDNANNQKEISCTTVPKVYINSIEKDGVIVKINAKKVKNNIVGYYFSYTNKRPDKNTGGYIATNKETIDVVRLPGTTYVWVEDTAGKISSPKNITIGTDEILMTKGNDYTILKGTALSTYLSNNGWSIAEFDKLMARSVRAAGLYSNEAAATAALTLTHVLAQKYKIKLPYQSAGLHTVFGVKGSWGDNNPRADANNKRYYGLDCSAFVNWAYAQIGFGITTRAYFWGSMARVDFSEGNGEVGDILVYGYGEQSGRHVKLIIGKTSKAFLTAEATGTGIVLGTHEYSKPSGYKIEKSINLTDLTKNKGYYKLTEYPSGF